MGQFTSQILSLTKSNNNNIHIIGKDNIVHILNRYLSDINILCNTAEENKNDEIYKNNNNYNNNEINKSNLIYSGYDCTICSNSNHTKIYAIQYSNNPYLYHPLSSKSKGKIDINYFNKHNIKITKICTNVNAFCTYYITSNYTVYENKRNIHGKLAAHNHSIHNLDDQTSTKSLDHQSLSTSSTKLTKSEITYTPKLIKQLYGVIDVQSAYNYSIALCSENKINSILVQKFYQFDDESKQNCQRNGKYHHNHNHYSLSNTNTNNLSFIQSQEILPQDIVNLICNYCKSRNRVWMSYGGDKWQNLSIFNSRNIIKICAAQYHSLFLEENGNLWYSNRFKFYSEPTPIKHFKTYKIKIKDIKCGESHNLAISNDNKLYSWSYHNVEIMDKLQFGDTNHYNYSTPKLVKSLYKYNINKIDCGRSHSYCSSIDNKHFLFGDNHWNQCLTFDKRDIVEIKQPFCINNKIKQLYGKNKEIKNVYLGPHHTIVLLKCIVKT